MTISIEQLQKWVAGKENEHLEFKEAKTGYEFDNLVKYCVALANEGGGRFILGVTDKAPRKVVGTEALPTLERTKTGILNRLHFRVDADEVEHPDGRVLVFTVPGRPVGVPIHDSGRYWMRSGESLTPMTPDVLRRIFDEAGPDFSAEICSKASLADLDPRAIDAFRQMWARKSGNTRLKDLSLEQLLTDAELLVDGGVTHAALVLFGTRAILGKCLAQAEVVFEYRSSEASLPAQQRNEYREGFFLFRDDLWDSINLRNDVQQFRDGLFVWDVSTFNEAAVREAILNAVTHRDYRLGGSVFIRQFPRKLEIVSPGGFPPGITPDNILWRHVPRNRRIAEACNKCGLVERSGQGMNRIFEECIRESKPRPDFAGSDDYQVRLTLRGDVQDPQFLRFLEKVGQETVSSFTTEDFLVLELLQRSERLPEDFRRYLPELEERGVIEKAGRGCYILSRRFYSFLGQKGVYTRKRGLDRETNKELLLKHIRDNAKEGSRLEELMQVLPTSTRGQVQRLVREMKGEGSIRSSGRTKGARWFPAGAGIAS